MAYAEGAESVSGLVFWAVYLTIDQEKAASDSDGLLAEMDDGVVDKERIARKPKKYRSQPVTFAMVRVRRSG